MNIVEVAQREVGYSRWADPQTGTKYGRWYATHTGVPYYGANGVPYCAMFVSWCAVHAGIALDGGVFAYCPTGEHNLRKAGREVSSWRDAKPGDIVFFDWNKDGISDHVGIVTRVIGGTLETIEGNTSASSSGSQTNGGRVAVRLRSPNLVKTIMRPSVGTTPDTPQPDIKETNMVFAFRPNGENRILFYDGQVHELRHEDELVVIQNLYRTINGRELPVIELGSEAEPWASRFLDAIGRDATNYSPLVA